MVAVGGANYPIGSACRCDARRFFWNINPRSIIACDFALLGNRSPTQRIQVIPLELVTAAGPGPWLRNSHLRRNSQ